MGLDKSLAAKFKPVKSAQETIIWVGRPRYGAFVLTMLPIAVFGTVFVSLFLRYIVFKWGLGDPVMLLIAAAFILVFLSPFSPLLSWTNTAYAITSERILVRGGPWQPAFKSLRYDTLTDVTVRPAFFEGLLGAGTIELYTGKQDKAGRPIPDKLISVSDPYKVFNKINQSMADYRARGQSQRAFPTPGEPDPITIDLPPPFNAQV